MLIPLRRQWVWVGLVCWAVLGVGISGAAADDELNVETVMVPMRDGVRLATDIYRPEGDAAGAVIFGRTPYNKELGKSLGRDGTRRGYVVVVQDTRGRFASEGENLPFDRDAQDGADSVAWIAGQPWSNGRIGTWGGSAGAIVQYQLAPPAGPGLGAQYLVVGGANLYEIVYCGGVFRRSLIEDWLNVQKFAPEALARWRDRPVVDEYWIERDASRGFAQVQSPSVHVGGYWDIFAQATIDAFVGYQTAGGDAARGRQKLLMGPWTHGVLQKKAGELTFPRGDRPPGEVEDSWRWFDRWLRDVDNGAERAPAVTYYVLGDVFDEGAPGKTWRTADQWPPPGTSERPYYFTATGEIATAAPEVEGSRTYVHDPANPPPTIGGIQLTIPAGPHDQRPHDARSDVLVFRGPKLTEPLEITGQVRAKLWVASSAVDTDFMVRLCDVYPDGRAFNLCEGMLRAGLRQGRERVVPLVPGEAVELDLDLWATSVILAPGHRLAAYVSSASAPGFAVHPNTLGPVTADNPARPAEQTVFVGGNRASHLILPVAN